MMDQYLEKIKKINLDNLIYFFGEYMFYQIF